MSRSQPQQQVRRRRVFYIPGYDPFPPRRYRELFRKEAGKQAKISGYDIELTPQNGMARNSWGVWSRQDGATVEAEIDVLVWSDIVQDSMSNSIAGSYLQLVRTAWIYIGSGALWRLMRLRKGPVLAAFYPVAMLLAQLALALMIGWVACWALIWIGLPAIVSGLAGLSSAALILRAARRQDNRLFAYYLMHDYAHSARHKGAYDPALEARLAEFGDLIAAALADDTDEVLVVGHSSGAHLAVSVLADLFRQGRVPAQGPALGLLTLGQVVPMLSFLPCAGRLRRDLRDLSTCEALAWVDVSAPGDGCSFALCDPVAVSGMALPGKRWPLVISAAFTQTLSPERWSALRWRFFRLHFQYLCAFDRPGDYDYFRITAGPMTLARRFDGRRPSKSRIVEAVAKYRSVAA